MTMPTVRNGNGRQGVMREERIVVGPGRSPQLSSYLTTLPYYSTDLDRDFGDSIWDEMLKDPQVSASLLILAWAALASGMRTTCVVQEETDPDYEQSEEVRQFVEYTLMQAGGWMQAEKARGVPPRRTAGSLHDVLTSLLKGAAGRGHKLAEALFREATPGERQRFPGIRGQGMMLARLKTKPRQSYQFVVDGFNNLIGLLPNGVTGGGVVADPKALLPPEKFVLLTWLPEDDDPRGNPQLRAAYDAWWGKVQSKGERIKFLAQFGIPGVEVQPPAGSHDQVHVLRDGTINRDENGNPVMLNPLQQAYLAALDYGNSAIIALPNGSVFKPHWPQTEGQVFYQEEASANREISKAVLLETLSSNEAEHGTRAQAAVHQDTRAFPIAYARSLVETALFSLCSNLVAWNYGEEWRRLCPEISLSEAEGQDLPVLWTALAKLCTANFLDESQYDKLDSEYSLPQREEGWRERWAAERPAMQPEPDTGPGADPDAEDEDDAEEREE